MDLLERPQRRGDLPLRPLDLCGGSGGLGWLGLGGFGLLTLTALWPSSFTPFFRVRSADFRPDFWLLGGLLGVLLPPGGGGGLGEALGAALLAVVAWVEGLWLLSGRQRGIFPQQVSYLFSLLNPPLWASNPKTSLLGAVDLRSPEMMVRFSRLIEAGWPRSCSIWSESKMPAGCAMCDQEATDLLVSERDTEKHSDQLTDT